MIVETAVSSDLGGLLVMRCVPEEAERRQDTVPRRGARGPPALDADEVGGEPEPHGGNARERRRRPSIGYQPVGGVRRFPEKAEGARLYVVEKLDVRFAARWWG